MITSSRSHKLMARVQHIEGALSPVEKAVLAQRSHLHYAYTAGTTHYLALTFHHLYVSGSGWIACFHS